MSILRRLLSVERPLQFLSKFSSPAAPRMRELRLMTATVHRAQSGPKAAMSRLLVALCLAALMLGATAGPVWAQDEEPEGQPGIGIAGFTAPDNSGAGVSTVVPGLGAAEAGLRTGDVITEVEGTEITSIEDLAEELGNYEAGDTVSITFERDGESKTVDVTLSTLPGSTRGTPPPLFGGEGFRGEPEREAAPEPEDSDLGFLPVVFVFGVLITGFLATLVVLKLKDRKKQISDEADAAGTPLEVARMRYARGEIGRDEFRTIAADLGEGAPPGTQAEERNGGDQPAG